MRAVADRYGLKVLEDGAQGFGGQIGDGRACSFGDIGTTSFLFHRGAKMAYSITFNVHNSTKTVSKNSS
ncbi:DegT/DnrJ/EryC1/StrS family aminotransferase [Mobilibacterium timonense]|uniref:DegT/DnrJ/EryC1/StrS family aminotransferase n=1 Tax=Mobilibacterium timonense TaxID=1871012 RepID=UPI000985407C